MLAELNSDNYISAVQNTIVSTDNFVNIKLKATDTNVGGIGFLLSWVQLDKPVTNIMFPEFDNFGEISVLNT